MHSTSTVRHIVIAMAIVLISVVGIMYFAGHARQPEFKATPSITAAVPVPAPQFTKQYIAALEVARVFGRSTGCSEADPKLIDAVASEAVKADISPRVLAATVAIESACNQYATSPKGAIGLLQVTPKTWKGTYDLEKQYNLLNQSDNLHVGTLILAGYIKQYGVPNGLHHYNGMGQGCDTCDSGYADKILALAVVR